MYIIGFKLKEHFIDVIGKVEDGDNIDAILKKEVKTFKMKSPMFLQFVQKQQEGNVSKHPTLQPVNTFTEDPKSDIIYFSMNDVLVVMNVSNQVENLYREALGDIPVAKSEIVMPQ